MELFSAEFFSALAAIIVIDLVLAGDNAIVIALAARNLPVHLRTRAVVWGTVGAIAVRTAMTLVVVWLLKIPGLLLAGGALLLWIAYKLLVDQKGEGHGVVASQTASQTFWGAMKTIIIADAVMGLDNVLAVAGAAHGSFLLVVLGLLISIPIVIWGSQLILKFVERYPVIVYIGAGVLAWTGVKMMVSEPLLKDYVSISGAQAALLYLAVVAAVLAAGFLANQRPARARVAEHAVELAEVPAGAPLPVAAGGNGMTRVLVPVDGSASALRAVRHVVNRFLGGVAMEVHLVYVRVPLSQHVSFFVSRRDRARHYRDVAERALQPARALLAQHGVPHAVHLEEGETAPAIDRLAQRLHVARIVIGTARRNSLTRLLQDSVTARLLALARVPVEVVQGAPVERWERVWVPAGAATAMVMLALALIIG